MKHTKRPEHLRRSVWPEVAFAGDIALILDISESEALEGLLDGRFGPYLEIQGSPAALRRDLLAALEKKARAPVGEKEVLDFP